MDFLLFFLGYVGIFTVVSLLVLFSSSTPFLTRLSEHIKTGFLKVVDAVVPGVILRWITSCFHYVFNTRNHVLQFAFGGLVMGGNFILLMDITPLLYIFEPDQNHILLPMVFLFSNAITFHLSCESDPGTLTPTNVALYASLYKADGVMYKDGVECKTCKLVKPPRSKHCSICGRCVHRFDHHCIWTNNCVGAGNLRFFIPFLLTLLAMVVNGAVMGSRAMLLMVRNLKMMESGYVDAQTGQVLPVTIPVLIQHLFMQYPRCVFLITSLIMLTVLLGLFTLYHLYLLVNNQTTNERYKMAALPINNNTQGPESITNESLGGSVKEHVSQLHEKDKRNNHHSHHHQQQQHHDKNGTSYLQMKNAQKKFPRLVVNSKIVSTSLQASTDSNVYYNNGMGNGETKKTCSSNRDCTFYNRGLFQNLREVFLPWADLRSLKNGKENIFSQGPRKLKRR